MPRRILLLISTVVMALLPTAANAHKRGLSVSVSGDQNITRCDQLKISFDNASAAIAAQELTVSKTDAQPLRVATEFNGGVVLYGGDKDQYMVHACKASSDQKLLEQIRVAVSNGQVSVEGPKQNENWMVYFIIETPKDANVDLKVMNSPVSIRNLAGRAVVRATNGPISVKDTTGIIDAEAINGPIAFQGSGGEVTLRAQNGPIDIDIVASRWQGAKLDAFTENGPVQLHLPAKFESAALVQTSNHSPFECAAEACNSARRTWSEDTRQIEIGGSPAIVKVSNVNGPMSVVDHKAKM